VPGLALALAACGAPTPPPGLPAVAAAPATGGAVIGAEPPGAAFARDREERRRGIGIPPALPEQGAVDRLSGTLRASQPAPGTGPAGPLPPPPPVSSGSLSRLSAIPASPLANPRGGSLPGRPW
jgi:hypothetical protein